MNAQFLPDTLLSLSTELRVEPGTTLAVAAAASVARAPTRALITTGDSGLLTFADLWSQAQQFAGGLANSRIIPGHTVAIALPPGDERLALELATSLLGAAFASLDHAATTEDAVNMLAVLEPDLIIVPRESTIARLDIPVTDPQNLRIRDDRKPRPVAANSIDAASIALRLPRPTSIARARSLTHAQVLADLHATARRIGLEDGREFTTQGTPARLDGCDPGWLALVTGGTWRIAVQPRAKIVRPVWRSLLERIALR